MRTIKTLLANHEALTHSTMKKVASHVQRQKDGWFINTVLIEGHDIPFKYKRKKRYQSLQGSYVDLIYYPSTETIAGIEFDYMKVVKISRC